MSSDLQQTRYDKLIRRVGGIIGPGSKVAEALPELFPVIDVERVPGELLLLSGTEICFGGGTILAIALEFPTAQLFNPDGSGKLVTLTSLVASSSSGTNTVRFGLTATVRGAAIGTETLRDTRQLPPARPVAQVRQESDAAAANATGQSRILNNTPFYLTDDNGIAVLAPGTGFEIGLDSAASQIHYTFYWRERVALESELNLP